METLPVQESIGSDNSEYRYRKDIDGLRAIAVTSVLLFHVNFGCPGGYVGVDVFFVISGFLIYSIIHRDLRSDTFSFARFWERRARRIAPALLATTCARTVFAWILLLPNDFRDYGSSLVCQSLMGANIFFWKASGYFAAPAETQPLLHNWSLAVEEQFYLIFPLALVLLDRIRFTKNRVGFVLTACFAVSLTLSIFTLKQYPEATFYLLPTRAWELILGALLVHLPKWLVPRRTTLRQLASLLGLALILLPLQFYSSNTNFPGAAAIVPCLGAAIIIAIGLDPSLSPPWVSKLLSRQPIVSIGLISYSLYLWHWPIIAFSKYWEVSVPGTAHKLAVVAMSFVLAFLSWKYIETPFRKRRLCVSRNSAFLWTAVGTSLALLTGVLIRAGGGVPSRFSETTIRLASFAEDRKFIREYRIADIESGAIEAIGQQSSGTGYGVLVWGDSHAMSAAPGFDRYLTATNQSGCLVTRSSTPPLVGYDIDYASFKEPAIEFNAAVFDLLKRKNFEQVVLVARWSYYLDLESSGETSTSVADYLLQTCRMIIAEGCRVSVMREVPGYPFNVPRKLAWQSEFGSGIETDAYPTEKSISLWRSSSIGPRLEAAGVTVLDPLPWLGNPKKSKFRTHEGPSVFYCDSHHLSVTGALEVLPPMLEQCWGLEQGFSAQPVSDKRQPHSSDN